ncbi:macrolide ABC transporter ATP-binding protein [Platysternon megacephalum]|uniref:Macrolide ABC transporter ATP-binding protein n=1 Tax=Platysternon megacephalum TaxID=55544 RepID=A0A4D9DHA2_9SAUR|nr:macrolide ABC transporter ATP-binding protein [Platysternon megacephalum]
MAAASESQGAEELGYVLPEAQALLGEVQAVQVKEEEASADELPPEPDPSPSASAEPQPASRKLVSALDRLVHLRARKRKAREDGPLETPRGPNQKHGRSQLELKRARRTGAWRAEERQSLAEFIQHDREMRREDREFQAQLLEKLFQKQLEMVGALAQPAPPLQEPEPVVREGAGLQFPALLEQVVQTQAKGQEAEAAGPAPARVPAQEGTRDVGAAQRALLVERQRVPQGASGQENGWNGGLLAATPGAPLVRRPSLGAIEPAAPQPLCNRVGSRQGQQVENGLELRQSTGHPRQAEKNAAPVPRPGAGKATELCSAGLGGHVGTDGVPLGRATIQGGSSVSDAQNGAPCEQQTPASLVRTERTGSKGGRTCSALPRSAGCASPGLDGPLLGALLETSLDSPWDREGSADRMPEGGTACPGAQPRCLSCTVLRADLDATREELRITQASTLYGLSGTHLQGLAEALGTISRILNDRRPTMTKPPWGATESPGVALPQQTHLS